ncbi:YciI family protein [Streptomyces sp. NPDC048604]|uniref:YciI family protein n=1 Tax=Streptomyces sp. NPDC048604 TaxID=3365578 RepID=UPI00371A8864
MLLMQFAENTLDIPRIDTWQSEDVGAHIDFMRRTNEKLMADGEFVEAQGLAMSETALIVKAGPDGAPLVTDGPFAETKEFLAGWWIVDVASEERAIAIAAHVSTAPGPGGTPINMPIEVRAVGTAPKDF